MSTAIHDIPIAFIVPGPNVRSELRDIDTLAASIRAQGLLQPITVCQRTGYPGQFVLVLGQRRLAACRKAGLKTIPSIIVSTAEASKVFARQLVENLQRDPMTPLEKMHAIRRLMRQHGWSQAQVANALGYSSGHVSTLLLLDELDAGTQQRVADGDVSVARATAEVRETRRVRREGGHRRPTTDRPAKVTLEAGWFTDRHLLAREVAAMCGPGHQARPKLGPGCGQCWEQAITAKAIRDEQQRLTELSVFGGGPVAVGGAA